MTLRPALIIPVQIYKDLRGHLFPGDDKEAAAILLCGRAPGKRVRLLVQKIIPIPYAACSVRTGDRISWPGLIIEDAIDQGDADDLSLILVHSHPGSLFEFSRIDDESDRTVIRSLFAAYGTCHGSAIMTPDGAVKGRTYDSTMGQTVIDLVMVPGDDIVFWWDEGPNRRPMAFTSEMTAANRRLSAVVIGASGTGSIVIEQLARLGFGRVVAVEFDTVEFKNLNRILNSGRIDAEAKRPKVEVMARAVAFHREADVLVPVASSIIERDAVTAAAECDFIFCCADTLEARYVADLMSTALLMPLIDMGVVIPVRRQGDGVAIADVYGRIDYVHPGGSTLGDRGVYTAEMLRAEYLSRHAPDIHREQLREGYIRGVVEQAPSVITLNMRVAAAAVGELIARLYPFRHEANRHYARTCFSLAACEEEFTAENAFAASYSELLGSGDAEPLLGLPALAAPRMVV